MPLLRKVSDPWLGQDKGTADCESSEESWVPVYQLAVDRLCTAVFQVLCPVGRMSAARAPDLPELAVHHAAHGDQRHGHGQGTLQPGSGPRSRRAHGTQRKRGRA